MLGFDATRSDIFSPSMLSFHVELRQHTLIYDRFLSHVGWYRQLEPSGIPRDTALCGN